VSEIKALLVLAIYVIPFIVIGIAQNAGSRERMSACPMCKPKVTRTAQDVRSFCWGSGATRAAIEF